MKKLLSIAMASLAVAALADPPANTASPTIGVTAITTSLQSTIVSVPFTSLNGGGAIDVKQLVDTQGFATGDWLYVFDGTSYYSWTITDGAWTPVTSASTSGGIIPAELNDKKSAVSAPGAIWVVFKNAPQAEKTFYIYGQYAAITSQSIVNGKNNLVANPLQSAAVPTVSGAVKGDSIVVPSATGSVTYSYTQKRNKPETLGWYDPSGTKLETFPATPQGQGFWYIRNAGEGECSISWSASAGS